MFSRKNKLVLPIIQEKDGICLALGYSLDGVNSFLPQSFVIIWLIRWCWFSVYQWDAPKKK